MSSRLTSLLALLAAVVSSAVLQADDAAVDFLREIKPIFVQRCYRCHSSLEQENNLRLDSPSAIRKGGDGGVILVPGKSGESRLVAAVMRAGELKMPPEGPPLAAEQIEKIKRWVDAGAMMPSDEAAAKVDHWAFQKPVRPAIPAIADPAWAASPIDAFVAAKHAEQKLAPVGEAPRNLLLRRLHLDLIGLPPNSAELAAFLADTSPEAYEKAVDSLLASPQYGERWGRHWMDVWRYSDWDGYGSEIRESKPHIWRWRDWIVESLNADKPYDRMVQEMLAADELSPTDAASLPATGYLVRSWYKFNRHKWMDDAIEHTGKAFLGLTFNCARCHDHMYDPLSQREYYSLRAIFEPYDIRTDRVPGEANSEKNGLVRVFDAKADAKTFLFLRGNEKQPEKDPLPADVPRVLGVPFAVEAVSLPPGAYYPGLASFVRDESRAAAREAVAKAKAELAAAEQSLATAKQKLAELVAKDDGPKPPAPMPPEATKLTGQFLADDFSKANDAAWKLGAGAWKHENGRLLQTDPRDELCGIYSVKSHPRDFVASFRFKTTGGDVYKSVGLAFDAVGSTDFQAVYVSPHSPGPHLWVRKAGVDTYPVSQPKNTAVEVGKEYELRVAVRDKLLNVWVNGSFVLAYPLAERAEGKLVLWTFDATAELLGVRIDPLPAGLTLVESGTGSAAPPATKDGLAGAVEDAERLAAIGRQAVAAAELGVAALDARIVADAGNYLDPPAANAKELSLAAGAAERGHALEQAKIALARTELKLVQAKRAVKAGDKATEKAATDADAALAAAKKALEGAEKAAAPSENYTRLTPLHPPTSTGRRLALARWITSRDNPLAARVAVNHLWLRHFGSPLVPSVFDFGINGKPSTNQPLLDWLAVELMENGWRMKPVHKLMVMSRTYRLASSVERASRPVRTGLEARSTAPDPENLYYWRANVRRMEAEVVRDATLHVAGSLDLTPGGPDLDPAAALTSPRRSLYFRASKEKRVEFLSLFDSANPTECYRRSESVAPQQALALANSPLCLAQSRKLAQSLTAEVKGEGDDAKKRFIEAAFLRILCRPPTSDETATCLDFLQAQATTLADAKTLTPFSSGPAAQIAPSADAPQRARENLVHVLMNHNDFVTIR